MECKVIFLSGPAKDRENALNFWLRQGWKLLCVTGDHAYLVK